MVQTILKLVVGSLIHILKIFFEHLKGNITLKYNLISLKKISPKKYIYNENKPGKQFEKFSLNFSSCNPFPSLAKFNCQRFQCTITATVKRNGPFFFSWFPASQIYFARSACRMGRNPGHKTPHCLAGKLSLFSSPHPQATPVTMNKPLSYYYFNTVLRGRGLGKNEYCLLASKDFANGLSFLWCPEDL